MRVLGIDPGDVYSGWAFFIDGALVDRGQINADGKHKWARRLPSLRPHFQRLIDELKPDLVGIEKTQVGGGQERTAAQAFSQAARTRNTEELAGELREMAARIGAKVERVTPQASLKAIGCKHGAKDREVRDAFLRMFPQVVKMCVKDHHECRAAGVAMAAEAQAKLRKRGAA